MTKFRIEAADAINAMEADLVIVTEYFPKAHDGAFQEALKGSGLLYGVQSDDPTGQANRVLIASRYKLETLPLALPRFDRDFPANVLGVRIRPFGLTILGVRVPWYDAKHCDFLMQSWLWLEATAAALKDQPAVIAGDLNVTLRSAAARGGEHFRRILQDGWKRAEPSGSSFGDARRGQQIDHILVSSSCTLGQSKLLRRIGRLELCEGEGALSDHAALIADVKVKGYEESNGYLYEVVDSVPAPAVETARIRKTLLDLGLSEEEVKKLT